MGFRNINVSVTADTAGYEAALKRASNATRQFKSASQGSVAAPVGDPARTNQATSALNNYKAMTQQVAKAQMQSGDMLSAASVKGTAAQKHLAAAQIMVRDALQQSAGATNIFSKGVSFASNMVKQLVQVSGGFMLIHGFVNVTSRAMNFMKDSFVDFNRELNESMAIMGDLTPMMVNQLRDASKAVSTFTTFSPADAAEGLYFLASAGYTAAQSIAMLPTVAKFAQAGLMDLDKASEMLTDIQKTFNQPPDMKNNWSTKDTLFDPDNLKLTENGAKRVGDVITKASIDSNATIGQIGEGLQNKLAAYARQIGMSLEEAASMIEVLSSRGIKGATAGTQSYIALRDLMRTALKNPSGYAQAGIQVFDEKGEMKKFNEIIAQFESKLGPMSDAARKAFFSDLGFQDRALSAIMTFVGTSNEMAGYLNANLEDSAGLADQVAKKQLKSVENQFKLVRNWFSRVADDAGNGLLAGWAKVTSIFKGPVKEAVNAFKSLYNSAKPVLKIIGTAVGGAFIGALTTIAKVLSIVSGLVEKFPGAAAGMLGVFALNKIKGLDLFQRSMLNMGKSFGSMPAFGNFMQGQGGIFSQSIGKINASIRGLTGLGKGKNPMMMMSLPQAKGDNIAKVRERMASFTNDYQQQFVKMSIIRKKWGAMMSNGVVPIAKGLGQYASGTLQLLTSPFTVGLKVAQTSFAKLVAIASGGNLGQKLAAPFRMLGSAASASMRVVSSLGNVPARLSSAFSGSKLEGGINSLKNAMGGLGNGMNNALMLAGTAQQRVIQGFTQMRSGMIGAFKDAPTVLANAFSSVPGLLTDLSQRASISMSSMGASIASGFQNIPIRLSQSFSAIPAMATRATSYVSDAFLNMSTRLSTRFVDLKSASTNMWSGFTRGVTGAIQSASQVGPALKKLGYSMLETIGSGSFRAWNSFKSGGQGAIKAVGDSLKSMWRQVSGTAANIGQTFTKGTAGIGGGSEGIAAAKQQATMAQAKQNALTVQYNMLLQQEAILEDQLLAVEKARDGNRSASTVAALEGDANITKGKIAQIEATMGLIETETQLAGVRKLAFANTGVAAPTAMSKFAKGMGKMASAAGAGLMTAMLLGPGILSDFNNRMKDSKDKLYKKLKDYYSIDLEKVLDSGTYDELQEASDQTGKAIEKANKTLEEVDTSNVEILGETLFGWIPGVKEDGKAAKAAAAEAAKADNEVKKDLNKIMESTSKVINKANKERKPGEVKWFDNMDFTDIQQKLSAQVQKMGGSMTSMKDVADAYVALQNEFQNIKINNPDMPYDQIAESVGGADAEDALNVIDEASKEFEKAFAAMFDSTKILEDAQTLADALRTALKTPAQIASDTQKGIDDEMKKNADAAAEAYNKNVESQVKNIEKQKKLITEAASDQKKRTKSDKRKESIDDARDAQIASLDDQKDAINDTKKASSDFEKERKMSIDEFIDGVKKSTAESDKFNGTLAIMSQMGLKDDVVAQFREMGEDAVPLLAEFASSSQAEMEKFVTMFNENLGKLGEKPVPKIEELAKKYGDAAAAQQKFINNMFETTAIAGKSGTGDISGAEMEAFVTTLGPDSQVLVQNFLDAYNGAANNPAAQAMILEQFRGLVKNVFAAKNIDFKDGFSEAMKTAMDAASGVMATSAAAMLDLLKDTGSQAAEEALKTAATLEASMGTGTKFQKAYYDFINKKNEGKAYKDKQSPYATESSADQLRPETTAESAHGRAAGKDKEFDSQGSGSKAAMIDRYNKTPYADDEQQKKWDSTAGKKGQANDILQRAMDKQASLKELTTLVDFASRWGKSQWTWGAIPQYAKGDIIDKPTVGMIGEAGPEVILPLSNRKRMIELLQMSLKRSGGVPKFADGGIVGKKSAMNGTKELLDSYSQKGAGVESSANQARSEMSTPVSRPASYDMINASSSGPSGGNVVVVPVPVESKTEYQFNGPIQGLTLEQVQADAQRKKRQAALV